MTNKYNTVIYIGVTSNLIKRNWEHKNSVYPNSFTAKYKVNKLVRYEVFDRITDAIQREKQLKGGSRKQKVELIESNNPSWRDISDEL